MPAFRGFRVVVPYLRGHDPARFRDTEVPRSGQQAVLGQDPVDLMDALGIERGFWYQFYFLTERGRAGLAAHRNQIARIMWHENSPDWRFDDKTFALSAAAFENPDYVDVVIHSYRHRLGTMAGMPEYEALESRLALLPVINRPAVTLDGTSDGVVPATEGSASARFFSGLRIHRRVLGGGHNLPQEKPGVFVLAVFEMARMGGRDRRITRTHQERQTCVTR